MIRTVTVLVIACPHALGLAIPLVIAISTATSARAGILVKDRLALERMRTVDAVLFDKTGTLTKGDHAVVDRAAIDGWDADEVLAAGGRGRGRQRAPARPGDRRGRPASTVRCPTATELRGAHRARRQATVDGHRDRGRRPGAARPSSTSTEPDELAETDRRAGADRGGVGAVCDPSTARSIGAVTLEDEIRPESRAAVDALHDRGVQVVMITGDARQVADAVAAELGIDEVFAEVLPEDKDAKVAELQAARAPGGDGRRRRQRRPGPRPSRRRYRDRRRHRRRHRVRRRRARLERSPQR